MEFDLLLIAAPRRGPTRTAAGLRLLLLAVAAVMPSPSQAAESSPAIYSCIDDKGSRLTSDRPIPECRAKEQRLHNQ